MSQSAYSKHEYNKLEAINLKLNNTIEEQTTTTEYLTSELEAQTEEKKASQSATNLGRFKITAYCACKKCCGKWAGGNTASGTKPTAGRTVAVDTSVIPFGTKVIIDGHTYIAEDTGSAIKGNRLDIFFDDHQEALNWGVRYKYVQIIK
jgi:3D (Asp-Asp-Asp) domain-containing protein